ncbi:hypothetical protein Smp_180800 [Schistosoma mansoni]|uniref:ORF3 n=1 Tax=Schistosoma mansoni TaxID=6183 RepID=G4V6G6_SCHMA|nr:hypothetical protein Smp_180800 [Schistosoma mansoni]|eukprot:XP_018648648.1 hypothetical protein Smp_180800 [Schistosoma mansoni]
MTKSIRSKSKRRFRAIKRRRSFKKIKDQLIGSIKKSEENSVSSEQSVDSTSNHMDIVSKSLPKILCNDHGTYPVWLSKKERKRQIKMRRLQKKRYRPKKPKV